MKNSFIIGVVWVSVLALIGSFIFTIFFLEGNFFESERTNLMKENNEITKLSFITDESSIRTNEFAKLENTNNLEQHFVPIDENDDSETGSGDIIESISKIEAFVKPIKGDVMKGHSTEELVYSKTLEEWTIHNGIDYKANLGQEVFTVSNGKIKEIDFDPKYGDYIIIEHDDNYESLYSNVTVLSSLNIGDKVEKGQIIGYLAESFGFEVAEETHLHFELKNDGKHVEIIL